MGIFTVIANFMVYRVFALNAETTVASALHFFIEDTLKIFVLLIVMIYIISFLRAGMKVEKVRDYLSGKNRYIGYFVASALGALTPFCSCSSIPLFLGFTAARIPVGITMTFLITSPTINEAAVVILGSTLGLKLTIIYVVVGMLGGILGGIFFDKLNADKWITIDTSEMKIAGSDNHKTTLKERHSFALAEVISILKRIYIWVIIGIAIGAGLHGYLPETFITTYLSKDNFLSVPIAVAIGIPTYTNATAVIPVISALIAKGLPVGTAFAFMLSSAAASIPELVMLKKVMHIKLLILFVIYLLIFFTLVGWIMNFFY